MMNNNANAIATVNSANFDMTSLLSVLKNSKATVIIINNGTPIDMSNIIDSTATEVTKKGYAFDFHKYYVGRVKGVLNKHGIKVKTGMGGAKRGYISASAFNNLVSMLETKEISYKRIKFLFEALDEAGYKEEGRGLKNDVLYELLRYIKENNLASQRDINKTVKTKNQYELDNLVEKLVKIPFTNDFAEKFANCLREDEVAYATFKLA